MRPVASTTTTPACCAAAIASRTGEEIRRSCRKIVPSMSRARRRIRGCSALISRTSARRSRWARHGGNRDDAIATLEIPVQRDDSIVEKPPSVVAHGTALIPANLQEDAAGGAQVRPRLLQETADDREAIRAAV